jgi:hypothetical protein
MGRWRLTPRGEAVLAEWKKTAAPAHQHRLGEVLETIGAGSWGRWWNQPYPSNPAFTELRAGNGLIVLARGTVDGEEDLMWIDLAGIWVVDRDDADLPIAEGAD